MFKWLRIEKVNDKVLCMVAIQHFLIYVTETIRSIKDPYCGSLATLFNEKHVRISLSEVCLKSEQAVGNRPQYLMIFRGQWGKWWYAMGFWGSRNNQNNIYTLWIFNIAMENGPFIDGLSIKNGDFPWLC